MCCLTTRYHLLPSCLLCSVFPRLSSFDIVSMTACARGRFPLSNQSLHFKTLFKQMRSKNIRHVLFIPLLLPSLAADTWKNFLVIVKFFWVQLQKGKKKERQKVELTLEEGQVKTFRLHLSIMTGCRTSSGL